MLLHSYFTILGSFLVLVLFAIQHVLVMYASTWNCPPEMQQLVQPSRANLQQSLGSSSTALALQIQQVLDAYSDDLPGLKQRIERLVAIQNGFAKDDSGSNPVIQTAETSFKNNRILHFQDPVQGNQYSSLFCVRGEPQECWFGTKFRSLDWSVRHCLFRNLVLEDDGVFLFYQDPNHPPIWDFNFGTKQVSIDVQQVKDAYGINMRVVNGSIPSKAKRKLLPDDHCTVFAQRNPRPHEQESSVWKAFEALSNLGMFALYNSIVILPDDALSLGDKRSWWTSLSKVVLDFDSFVNASKGSVIPLSLFGPRTEFHSFSNEFIAQTFRDRAMILHGMHPPFSTWDEDIFKRKIRIPHIGIRAASAASMHGFLDVESVAAAIKKQMKLKCRITILTADSLTMLQEMDQVQSFDLYITPSGLAESFSASFVKNYAAVIFLNTCRPIPPSNPPRSPKLFLQGISGNNYECLDSPGADIWSSFSYFLQDRMDIIVREGRSPEISWFAYLESETTRMETSLDIMELIQHMEDQLSRMGFV